MTLAEVRERMRTPLAEQIFHWSMMVGVAIIIGLLGWGSSQLISMRDDIHTVKDAIPDLQRRVDRLERHQDALDLRVWQFGQRP